MNETRDDQRTLEKLRESEAAYRTLAENIPDIVYRVHLNEGRMQFFNDRIADITGYSRDEMERGRVCSMEWCIVDEDRPRVIDAVQKAIGERSPFEVEYRFRHKNGSVLTLLERGAVVSDGAGVPLFIDGVIRDITERKRREEALRRSEKKYRLLFDSTTDGIYILDDDGRFLDANHAAYTRLGYTREELLALSLRELDSPEFAAKAPERMRQINDHGMAVFESVHMRKDGSRMPVEVNVRLIDLGGRPVYFSVVRDITERKRAEEAIAERSAMLQQIMDTASVGIGVVDMSGRFVQANRRMAEMFGYTTEEFLGTEYVAHVDPSSCETASSNIRALLSGEMQSADLERVYQRKDGTEFWGHLSCSRYFDARGNSLGVIGAIMDVTEKKRAEDALRKSEKMLQTIIEAEPECVKVLDGNGCLIMMNRAGLDMLQADSLEQVRGQCVCPMVAPGHRETFMDLIKRVFRGESGILEFEMTGLKGRSLRLETHAVPLRNEKDEIIAMLGVTRDITVRRRSEAALHASETRFRAIIESASVGILVAEVETRSFRYANPEICRMLGYSSEELLALSVRDIHPAEELRNVDEGFRRQLEGSQLDVRTQCRRKDGSLFPVIIRSTPLEIDGRRCIMGFFTDATEQRLLEEERLKTEKLASIGTLAGGIAHDFNNLLQGVFGYISMAKLTLDRRERSLAMLEQAEKALHQSVALASQLLAFSKGGKPVKRTLSLFPVIENAVKFALSGSRADYRIDIAPDLRPVEADEGQLGQVIQNIVLNADQAMPLGGRIEIEARNARAASQDLPPGTAGDHVRISIRDSGVGIPPEFLPRIFDPYFTTKEKGSGLGLATSYAIIRNHGGVITVSSEPGKGSSFSVFLPASALSPEKAAAQEAPRRARQGRVLIMDDEEIVRMVIRELMRELGQEALCVDHGADAVDAYRKAMDAGRGFDIVILDLTIRGGMGGLETLKKLREIDPDVKAVVSSGYSDDEIVSDFRKHGFIAFLKKPYDLSALREVLDANLP